jgi:murein DD-endopeptidase MepM/ murein hydrolase activator NlpD
MKKRNRIITLLIALSLFMLLLWLFLSQNQRNGADDGINTETELQDSVFIELKYGLPVDSFNIIFDTVKTGSTLSDILQNFQVSLFKIDFIGKISTDTFRVDRIRAGQPYAVFCDKDTSAGFIAKYMVYETNGIDYTVYDFRDSVVVSHGKKPVKFVEKTVKGTIESSLWMSLKNNSTNPSLALEMSEIFAWVIDFFGIQKGDEYRIIYEEVWVDNRPLYINRILAGQMIHMGHDYTAIPFTVDSVESFYEPDGASLRRTFLKAPLKFNRISSRFTNNRFHPVLHVNRPHRAVDYSAPTGTPIRTIGDGVVTLRKYSSGAGNYIKIKHNSVYTTVYMHMSGFGDFQVGERVKQGDIIGYVGSTGLSTGPHLHFEVHKNGEQIDPLKLESPPADPVPDSLMDEFAKVRDMWLKKINEVE